MTTDLRPGLLFDVDGTLFDTNYLHTLTWSRALGDAHEWAPMNAIHRLVGMGSDQLVRELLGHESADAVAARPKRYAELVGEAQPFPGAADLLRECHTNRIGSGDRHVSRGNRAGRVVGEAERSRCDRCRHHRGRCRKAEAGSRSVPQSTRSPAGSIPDGHSPSATAFGTFEPPVPPAWPVSPSRLGDTANTN